MGGGIGDGEEGLVDGEEGLVDGEEDWWMGGRECFKWMLFLQRKKHQKRMIHGQCCRTCLSSSAKVDSTTNR